MSLTAGPDSGWEVGSWWGTSNDGSTATTNSLTMPAASHSAGVNYTESSEPCYVLSLSHTGSGSDPAASPSNSSGCSSGQYHAGEVVSLTASPVSGWEVGSWYGTDNNASTSTSNTVTMPAANSSAGANYSETTQACYPLSLGHTGSGTDPTASPASSTGCSTGQYQAGESITLSASPASGWEVASWYGTDNNASTSTTNTVSMPASSRSSGVNYTEPMCEPKGASCSINSDCCSNKCRGKTGRKFCK